MEHIVSWQDIILRVNKLDKTKKYYGVPRGGQYIAAMLNPVDTPEEADYIIDDLLDSGATSARYSAYGKKFIVLFDKTKEEELKNKWLVFPWEKYESPVEDNITRILEYIGEDVRREGLKDTPKRYIKFLKEFLTKKEFNFTSFDAEGMDQMIVQKNIQFHSLCEHHLAPFFGTATIAYIPNGKIVGLSKLSRVVEYYASNLQNQERITQQIADKLQEVLQPIGVAVSLQAEHLCMSMRGVKKIGAKTTTQCLRGAFLHDDQTRNEFMQIINRE
jgi:GTP cyclohydrolase I